MATAYKMYEGDSTTCLDELISELHTRGYDVIAPTVRNGTVILASIDSSTELPRGIGDKQEKGTYQLVDSKDQSYFGYNLGPTSWKSFLFPANHRLWRLKPDGNPEGEVIRTRPYAFLGVRACELAAINVQDRLFLRDGGDPLYRQHREGLFLIGVHCRTVASTCFCSSMGTGPEFEASGWDLLLTEECDRMLLQAATARGQQVLDVLVSRSVVKDDCEDAQKIIDEQIISAKASMIRKMDQKEIKEEIYKSLSSSHWDDVGSRCLACANCTMVCPTCFCSTVEDVSDVENAVAERWQKWDSCFHIDFSYVHGGSRRVSTASRYRQWFSHKLATWHDQFGSSGCVGCGRCIAWCPVGIDITEEMAIIRRENERGDKK